jgi:hypothetical protein
MLCLKSRFNVGRIPGFISRPSPICVLYTRSAMIGKMFGKISVIAVLLASGFLIGCGTSSTDPDGGSKRQASTGVSSSGYPGGEPKDPGSPALASSTESQYSRDQVEKKEEPARTLPSSNK